jgi:predicted GNAT family acetyltransferase
MEINFNLEGNRFELEKDGLMAVADFKLKPGLLIITHVIVPPPLRGSGIASALAAEVVAHARREGLKVEPQCSFMAAYFSRHPEQRDLLA